MKIEAGKTYKTRLGDKVRILAIDAKGCPPVVGLIDRGRREEMRHWYDDGMICGPAGISEDDLVAEWREPIKVSGWVLVYPNWDAVYPTKKAADKAAAQLSRLHGFDEPTACVYVEGVEGKEPT